MNDFSRLEAIIAKLRQRERAPGEGRKLRGKDANALLAAIVMELDETILPRVLTFTTPTGSARLAVANRRLQALVSPAPKGFPAALADQALPDAEDPNLLELGPALLKMLEGETSVAVSASKQTTSFASDIGVPANQLAQVWSLQQEASPAASPAETLEAFLAGLDTQAVAWLRIEGEDVTGQGGPDGIVEALGEQAAVFLDGYFSKFDEVFAEPSTACATLLAPRDALARAMLFVEIGDLSAFITGPAGDLPVIAQKWQARVAE